MALPDNEFKDLTVPELRAVAKTFDIDVSKLTRKNDVITAITGAGITWEMYVALSEVDDEDELPFNEGGLPDELVHSEVGTALNAPVEPEPVLDPHNLDPFEALLGESLSDLDEPVAPAPVEPEPEVVVVPVAVPVKEEEPTYRVVKLINPSRYFEALSYVFTREHPYVLVLTDDASTLIENFDGAFREASPREVKEFYGD